MKNGESTYEPPRGRGKNKCFWTPEEVKALVEALKELSYDPLWKNDGGFKQNYMFEVHNIISSKIPNFTKKVDPHVESKVKWLKSKFYAISKMLRQSGCKWNAAEKMISCERQWYDNWVKVIIGFLLFIFLFYLIFHIINFLFFICLFLMPRCCRRIKRQRGSGI